MARRRRRRRSSKSFLSKKLFGLPMWLVLGVGGFFAWNKMKSAPASLPPASTVNPVEV